MSTQDSSFLRGMFFGGKKEKKKFISIILIISWMVNIVFYGGISAYAGNDGDIVSATDKTYKYVAPNGVPVVNIAPPNSSGLSHNKYHKFNVNQEGAVLNNNNDVIQTQLAGAIRGNPNIVSGKEAKVILNEVVSANRSYLRGFIEVGGKSADVIVANPWGITADGVGFINTSRAVLTTGTPNIDAAENLQGFRVTQGDLLVEGKGIDGTRQTYLDLVVRSASFNGPVNADNLHITTGANDWNYTDRTSQATTGSGAVSTYAIDSTLFGGMYANKIHIVATEDGVGVRALGEMAASADDLIITSKGTLELKNKISSKKDVKITYEGSDVNGGINISSSEASVTAEDNLNLTSTGKVILSKAFLKAGNNLSINSLLLEDSGEKTDIRSADNNIDITTQNKTNISGTQWIAGGAVSANVGEFKVGANGAWIYSGIDPNKTTKSITIEATTDDIDLASATIETPSQIILTANSAGINIGSGVDQGIRTSGDVTLNARTNINVDGKVLAGNNLIIRSKNSSGNLILVNTGRLQAGNSLDMTGYQDNNALKVENKGLGIIVGDILTLKANALTNEIDAYIQGTQGSIINVSSTLNNSGSLILSDTSGKDGTITAGIITNSGTIQGKGNINVNFGNTGDFTNTGKLLASSKVILRGSNRNLSNSGRIQAGGLLDLGSLSLNNQGSGILLGDTLTTNVATLTNAGTIQGTQGSTVNVAGTLNNSGSLILSDTSGKDGTITAGAITNSGTVQGKGAVIVNFGNTGDFTNTGKLLASGVVWLKGSNSGRLLDNWGRIQAGGQLRLDNLSLENRGDSAVLLGATFTADVQNFSNYGIIQGQMPTVNITNTFYNSGTFIGVAGTTTINARWINNTPTGTLYSKDNLYLTANKIDNSNKLLSDGQLRLRTGQLTNTGSGLIQAGGLLDIADYLSGSSLTFTNQGTLLGNRLALKFASLTNSQGATIQGVVDSDINVTDILNNAGKLILSTENFGVTDTLKASTIENTGVIQGAGDIEITLKNSGVLQNRSNAKLLITDGSLKITSDSASGEAVVSNYGRLEASGINITGYNDGSNIYVRNDAGAVLSSRNGLTINSNTVENYGTIQNKAGDLSIIVPKTTGSFRNYGVNSLLINEDDAGSSTLNVTNLLTNEGAIHGNSDFTIIAGTLENKNTAGISSLKNLSIITSNDFTNYGALYAGTNLNLTLTALGKRITNRSTMDSDGNININTVNSGASDNWIICYDSDCRNSKGELINYGAINAKSNINITTGEFKNISEGAVKNTVVTYEAMSRSEFETYDKESSGEHHTNYWGGDATKGYKFKFNLWHPDSGTLNDDEEVEESNSDSDKYWSVYQFYRRTWDDGFWEGRDEATSLQYVRGIKKIVTETYSDPGQKAQIIAGGALNINMTNGQNKGGILSADTINLTGTGSFTNDALVGTKKTYQVKYGLFHEAYDKDFKNHQSDGTITLRKEDSPGQDFNQDWSGWTITLEKYLEDWHNYSDQDKQEVINAENELKTYALEHGLLISTESTGGVGAGIFARVITGNFAGSVTNAGDPRTASTNAINKSGTGNISQTEVASQSQFSGGAISVGFSNVATSAGLGSGTNSQSLSSVASILGFNLNLPTNPNGYFVMTKSPLAKYLVERNPRFGLDADYLGSDYLAEKLRGKVNTNENIRRLGDAAYENYLITQQIIAQTGRPVLSKYQQNAKLQTQAFFDNAAEVAGNLNLTYGVALTKAQVDSLTKDIVWMVKQVVQGQEVLVPVVYLAKATLENIDKGNAQISAEYAAIEAKSLTNEGGTVEGSEMLVLKATEGDITNISGKIKGGDVALLADKGSIVNKTLAEEHIASSGSFGRTDIGKLPL
jgi:filamentous hemagglutinin family protein